MSIEYPFLVLLGAFLTFYLAKHSRFDGIRASSSLSIIAYLIFSALNLNPDLYAIIFFGGTFIGMSAPHRFGIYTVASSSVLFSILLAWFVSFVEPKVTIHNTYISVTVFSNFVCIFTIYINFLVGLSVQWVYS